MLDIKDSLALSFAVHHVDSCSPYLDSNCPRNGTALCRNVAGEPRIAGKHPSYLHFPKHVSAVVDVSSPREQFADVKSSVIPSVVFS